MEKVMIVLNQGALEERPYDNGSKTFKKVNVELTDGKDSFACEATDDLAVRIDKEKLSKGHIYFVDATLQLRTFKDQNGQEKKFNSIRLNSIRLLV